MWESDYYTEAQKDLHFSGVLAKRVEMLKERLLTCDTSKIESIRRRINRALFFRSEIKTSDFNFQHLEASVCNEYELNIEGLKGKTRAREYVQGRQLLLTVNCVINKKSQQRSGITYNRDHTTVIHAMKCVTSNLNYQNDYWSKKMSDFCKEYKFTFDSDYVSLFDVLIKKL